MEKRVVLLTIINLILLITLSSAFLINIYDDNSNHFLQVTQEHPFFVNEKWISASDLKVGDELTTIDGKKAIIKKITNIVSDEPIQVYNLETKEYENFVLSDGIIVHNSNRIKYPTSPINPEVKPVSWSNDEWNEYLLDKSGRYIDRTPIVKKPVEIENQVLHFEGELDLPGSGGAVFFEKGSNKKRVIKVARGDYIINEPLPGIKETPIDAAVRDENYYIREIENMKLADRLGLRKFYGEVEVVNSNRLFDTSIYPGNKNLLAKRAYSMDYVEGSWPSEMKQYISQKTLDDALSKYRKLWDAGYVQTDFQFFVTKQGTAEIIDFGGVVPRASRDYIKWESIVLDVKKELGFN